MTLSFGKPRTAFSRVAFAVGFFLFHAAIAVTHLLASSLFFERAARVRKLENPNFTLIYLAGIGLLSLGYVVGASIRLSARAVSPPAQGVATVGAWDRALKVLCAVLALLSIAGHANLFALSAGVLASTSDLIEAKRSLDYSQTLNAIPLVQLCIVAASLFGYLLYRRALRRSNSTVLLSAIMVALGLLVVARSLLLSERLALFEFVLPLGIYRFAAMNLGAKLRWTAVVVLTTYLFFSLGESLRSWPVYRDTPVLGYSNSNLYAFSLDRMVMYYLTGYNNAVYAYSNGYGGASNGYGTFRWFWEAPGFSNLWPVAEWLGPRARTASQALLVTSDQVSPEYNLFGLIGYLVLDWGPIGVCWCFAFGFGGALVTRLAASGSILGVGLLPLWALGVLESGRLLYWTHDRILLPVLAVLLIALLRRVADQGQPLEPEFDPAGSPT